MDIKKMPNLDQYKIGDTSHIGYKIASILMVNKKCIIFRTDTPWDIMHENDTTAIPFETKKVKLKYEELTTTLISLGYPEYEIANIRHELGIVLYTALNEDTEEKGLKQFGAIEKKINALTPRNKAQFYSLMILTGCCIFSTLTLAILFHFINTDWKAVFLCAIAGCIGSFLSMLYKKLEIDFTTAQKKTYILTTSLIKIFLGIFFGGMVYLISKSNLALGVVSDNLYALLSFSVLAGLSERFIPDLFKKIENINK